MQVEFTLNGEQVRVDVPANALLLDVLRDELGLTGTKLSCGVQVCGACTVLVDGDVVSSCCFLAHDAAGREVATIEGLKDDPLMHTVADAFLRHAALQCGFCTPGMVLTLWTLVRDGHVPDQASVRRELAGNICRCTGYKSIVDAAVDVAVEVAGTSR
jgi:aerobic-type carbon monoxide dehydrogenase small subunit (CoxS/CutS family)